jgi:glutathione synthase/RimK-type ligase-like ATP-grasp enzyme
MTTSCVASPLATIVPNRIDLNTAAQKAARLPELCGAGQQFFAAGNMEAAKAFYEAMLGSDPKSKSAHAGLYYVYSALGDKHCAASHLGAALNWPAILKLPYRGINPPVPVLLLLSMNSGNVLLQRFLNDRIFQTYVVLIESYNDAVSLPEHRLIVNGVGDADIRTEALLAAERVLTRSTAPFINPPHRVLATGRCSNAQRLGKIPGVRAPRSVAYTRERLMDATAPQELREQGFEFPLLVRAPGFHMGRNFVRVESPGDLAASVAELPGDSVIVMEYLDGCGSDGNIRKYRVLTIGGKLYPVHLAIAKHWKIHYFSADMADHCEHRAEESRFLCDIRAALGPKVIETLKHIQASLGLDYGGIDFGLNPRGEVLLYEANATMAVYRPDASPKWDYRRASIERIYAAVQELFLSRANAASPESFLTSPETFLASPESLLSNA